MKKKIVITGMGAVTPIGSGVDEYWKNLIAGTCGIDRIRQFDAEDLAVQIAAEVHSFDLQKYMPKKMIHETDAFTQYAYVAAAEALAMAGGRDAEATLLRERRSAGDCLDENRPVANCREQTGREGDRTDGDRPVDNAGVPGTSKQNAREENRLAGQRSGETLDGKTGIPGAPEQTPGTGLPADPDRMGIVMGTAMAGVATTAATQEILTNAVHKNVGPRFVPRILGNIAAAQIAIAHGITGHSVTLSTACASGGDAVSAAAMLLQADEADAVLAVGAESILCPLVIYSLANAHTLSRVNDDPQHSCRPFDAERSGFVIGEGGGALVLETEENALARGATIYAELAGWANNNDAYHVIKPNPDGVSSIKCMKKALKQAGLSPRDIDYINAHGTGTKLGDEAELNALGQLFGRGSDKGLRAPALDPGTAETRQSQAAAPTVRADFGDQGASSAQADPRIQDNQEKQADSSARVISGIQAIPASPAAGRPAAPEGITGGAAGIRPAISSTKGATGHMMGAGGITESIACIQAIREGIVPPTLNLTQCDSPLDLVRGESRRMAVDVAMTNAFGFGGQNSSLIFRRY